MSELVTIIGRTIDLDKTIVKETLFTLFATEDAMAHRFELTLERGGQAIDLTGHGVAAYFTPKAGGVKNSIPIVGKIEDGKAVVTLEDTCYNHAGPFVLVIKVTKGKDRKAVYVCESSMMRSHTDELSDEGNVLDIDELLAKIADMEAATADGLAAAQEARDAGAEAKATADASAAEALAAAQTVQSIYDFKADAIMDTSERAASHSLHAQDGPLAVTLYGKTTETGTGDKSPDNPYVISGVDTAQVRAGGKNLLDVSRTELGTYNQATGEPITGTTSQSRTTYDVPCVGGETFVYSNEYNANGRAFFWNSGIYAGTMVMTNKAAFTIPSGVTSMRISSATQGFGNQAQLERGYTATANEPYTANVITPALLPDGAPLMGNGTVDDTIENDVLSGCDKKIVLDGTQASTGFYTNYIAFSAPGIDVAKPAYSSYLVSGNTGITAQATYPDQICICRTGGSMFDGLTQDEIIAYLAANPLTVYYRSTDYTPDKDIRVCKTVRRRRKVTLTGGESYYTSSVDNGQFVEISKIPGFDLGSANLITRKGIVTHGALAGIAAGGVAIGFNGWAKVMYARLTDYNTAETLKAFVAGQYAAGTPIEVVYNLPAEETYMTDPLDLRKPDTLESDTVTVTGSAETAVTYPHDTKHFIVDFVTKALAAQV